ncbi:hypothetical protein [Lactobacillus sp. ESL0677]|uniref:hypothetical protein n=1 Tax=Lactobacillus sp. ESL0677 TaxID=2983208 RepID=UPI0023F96D84|nr:hypothetical protein [Lactobacillus sp. ESL0677]WEV36242.1 hypothetical protein OZX76_05710 [Lactobacillus sp. ESL0677]
MIRPWNEVPEDEKFTYKGYKCEIWEHPTFKILCGYVMIPKNNKLFGKDYMDNDFPNLDVHGGITYVDYDQENNWWIGFDCNHLDDYSAISPFGTYKDKNFITNELKKLVDQVLKYEKISC